MSRKNNRNRNNANTAEVKKQSQFVKARKARAAFPSKEIIYGQEGGNDPSYWNKNPQLTKDAANISLFTAAGVRMDNIYPTYSGNPNNANRKRFPGIMAFDMVPTYGISNTDESSILNVAARNLYSYVRHANSGHSNYDSPDLMCYLIAMDSIRYLYKYACRTYGIMQTVSPMNRYLPNALYTASGFNSIATDLSQMPSTRTRLNNLALKINSLYLPKSIDVFRRHEELFSYVYQDSPEAKAQIYIMKPAGYYKWDETTLPAKLVWTEFSGSSMPYLSSLISAIESALDSIITSEDFQIMSGDILKAFGANRLEVVPGIDETYSVTPIYNAEMLMEIENMTVLYGASSINLKNLDITQNVDTGMLVASPYYVSNYAGAMTPQYINFHKDVVEPIDVLTATRMKVAFDSEEYSSEQGKWIAHLSQCGTEICARARIYIIADSTGSTTVDSWIWSFDANNASGITIGYLHKFAGLSKFDWAPFVYLLSYTEANNESTYANEDIIGDFDNYALIDGTTINNCHIAALTSAYGIPYTA